MAKVEIQELESWLVPLIAEMGMEVVDIELAREPKGFILRLYIDREPDGVTIADCEKVSEQINFRLETVEEYKRYNISRLEVSSPGLDRKLKSDKDYQRELGRNIRVILKSPIGKQNTFSGILKSYFNGKILLEEQKSNQEIEINIADIAVANLEVDWRSAFKTR
ncbi:MAG: ribosome maturation factor RimP [bacterium]|nr:ribosome maturation factor RimP [bacterium]